ncbi:hypothetical protein WN73_37745 [Bradyrhizobium sp. CCBAU 45394]|nr:hypothetical protein [Bradyrhizobium sp. CCBAU 45394]
MEELERRGEAVEELRHLLDRGHPSWSSPPRKAADLNLPPMLPEQRPQGPSMDGSDMRLEGYRVETREHAGEYPDTMPRVIEVSDAEGRKAAYVPLSRDGKVVDTSAVVNKLKQCEDSES